MGWASATSLFDGAVDVALKFIPIGGTVGQESIFAQVHVLAKAVVEAMYTQIDWEDWDTQDESKYYDDYLIHIMYELGEIEENHYQYHLAGRPDDWDWTNKGW